MLGIVLAKLGRSGVIEHTQCSPTTVFTVTDLGIVHVNNSRGVSIYLDMSARLTQMVNKPYVEGRFGNDRIPVTRFTDTLCRPGVLTCPATFSTMNFGQQIAIPSTIEVGEYHLKLVFREDRGEDYHDIIACYDIPIQIKK